MWSKKHYDRVLGLQSGIWPGVWCGAQSVVLLFILVPSLTADIHGKESELTALGTSPRIQPSV